MKHRPNVSGPLPQEKISADSVAQADRNTVCIPKGLPTPTMYELSAVIFPPMQSGSAGTAKVPPCAGAAGASQSGPADALATARTGRNPGLARGSKVEPVGAWTFIDADRVKASSAIMVFSVGK